MVAKKYKKWLTIKKYYKYAPKLLLTTLSHVWNKIKAAFKIEKYDICFERR